MATANFFQPGSDAELENQQIQRQRDMALMLMQQSQRAPQGQMVSGHYVAPSIFEGINNVAKGYVSRKTNEAADEQQRAMGAALRDSRSREATDFMRAMSGTPATYKPMMKDMGEIDPSLAGMGPVDQPDQPAVAPDKNRAMAIALGSQNPMLQKAGGDLMSGQILQQQIAAALGQGQGSSQGGMPGAGGGVGGLDPRVIALSMTAGGEKLAGMLNDANKPVLQREGDVLLPDGKGGFKSVFQAPKLDPGFTPQRNQQGQVTSAGVIPGYAEGVAQVAGAKTGATEQAKAANDTVTVDTPSGPRLMTREQAVKQAGGGQPRPANPTAPQPGDSDRSLILNTELQAAQSRLSAARTPEERARADSDIAGLKRELGVGKAPSAPQTAQAPGIALQDDASKKFGSQVAAKSADALLEGRDKAKAAADDLLGVTQARNSMNKGAFQGAGADAKLAIAKFINANVPGITVDAEKVANTDYLKSTLGAGLLSQAKTLGANPSNADATRINDIVGSLSKDPGAMKKILDWREEMGMRAITNHNSTVDDAEQRGMKSPYDLRVKQPAAPTAAPAGFPNVSAIDAEIARRKAERK